jgi:periplasmic divalent cation tolerance protein
MIIIYVTCVSKEEARKIADYLLDEKLIACANILDSFSMYRWEGRIEQQPESIMLLKTTEGKYEKVKKAVEKLHSYDTPCILKVPVGANEKYLKWLEREVR